MVPKTVTVEATVRARLIETVPATRVGVASKVVSDTTGPRAAPATTALTLTSPAAAKALAAMVQTKDVVVAETKVHG